MYVVLFNHYMYIDTRHRLGSDSSRTNPSRDALWRAALSREKWHQMQQDSECLRFQSFWFRFLQYLHKSTLPSDPCKSFPGPQSLLNSLKVVHVRVHPSTKSRANMPRILFQLEEWSPGPRIRSPTISPWNVGFANCSRFLAQCTLPLTR
jgi:hypothetical protein